MPSLLKNLASAAALDDEADAAVTHKFVRLSAPYERIELDTLRGPSPVIRRPEAPQRYAATVRKSGSLETGWFAKSDEEALIQLDALVEAPAPPASWWWLPLSLSVALLVLALVMM